MLFLSVGDQVMAVFKEVGLDKLNWPKRLGSLHILFSLLPQFPLIRFILGDFHNEESA